MSPRALYLWALLPTLAFSAEGLILPSEAGVSLSSVMLQGGIGGLAAVVAVKMLLILYHDKERAAAEFHGQLLTVIQTQITVNKDMISSNNELIKMLQELKTVTYENRTLFLRHKNKELVE